MLSEPVKQMKDRFTELNDPPMAKVVEAVANRSWYSKCAASVSMYSLKLIGGDNGEDILCTVNYWHPAGHNLSLPPVNDMLDSYELHWRLNGRHDSETGLTLTQIMEKLDDMFSNNGEKYFRNQGGDGPKISTDMPTSDSSADEPTELTALDNLDLQNMAMPAALSTAGLASWKARYLLGAIPSLCMDRRLKIIDTNESFCRLFGCDPPVVGMYFTQFFAASFGESERAQLFHSVLSRATGYSWHGRVEKTDKGRPSIMARAWVLPVDTPGSEPPQMYSAVCVDITDEYRVFLKDTLMSLLSAARLKEGGNHHERVNRYAKSIAAVLVDRSERHLIDWEFVERIGVVAALHDIGKLGTPDDILYKAGPLKDWEWEVMKLHTVNGAYILSTYPDAMAREIALRHHEKWDGTGYPNGLCQDLIPLSARIVALADSYDALRMCVSYRAAFTHERAMEIIVPERGTHFDPYLIDLFVETSETFRRIYGELSDS